MVELIYKSTVYEAHEGTSHIFEVYKQNIENAAPFVIMMDGSFLTTAENGPEISAEIEATIKWFGWIKSNPVFA